LQSLAEQHEPLEVAFLDASGDPRVVKAADDSGIEFAYRRTGPDTGQSAAISEGWRETYSDVLFWLNGDDQLTPNALTTVRELFETENPDIVFGQSDFIDATGQHVGRHEQVAETSALLLRSNTISQPSCFARRRAIDAIGGINESLQYVMDWDLWARLYQAKFKFHHTNAVLSAVCMGPGTKTNQVSPGRLSEVFRLVNRNVGAWSAVKSTAALALETLRQRQEAT
ncbi:MAG: glycosyltransferase, partial [Maricaulis sp.]|nr:glycosyltransferase [Maricaulis sp.]